MLPLIEILQNHTGKTVLKCLLCEAKFLNTFLKPIFLLRMNEILKYDYLSEDISNDILHFSINIRPEFQSMDHANFSPLLSVN